jgi:hypothetical protein
VLRLRLPEAPTRRQRIQVQGGTSSGAGTRVGSGRLAGRSEGGEGTS